MKELRASEHVLCGCPGGREGEEGGEGGEGKPEGLLGNKRDIYARKLCPSD